MTSNKDKRFGFGKNWREFSAQISPADYKAAKQSLEKMLGDLDGKTFLDAGCGSGLFSIAASALGAGEVVGIDLDPICVETAKKNLEVIKRREPGINPQHLSFFQGSILDDNFVKGRYDIVYSWGVLHHTGDMLLGFKNTAQAVKPGGLLYIAVYNRHFTSWFWKQVKHAYNISPGFIKGFIFRAVYALKFTAVLALQRKNPLRKERGMNFYFDIRDWVGGYPYEYASVEEVTGFFKAKGFIVEKVKRAQGFTGCNEFVFRNAP